MIKVTLTFNTADEALAALKKLEDTGADPVGKSVKTDTPTKTPLIAASAAVPETKPEPLSSAGETGTGRAIDFKNDIAPAFLALAKTPGGGQKQADIVKHFGVERLSQVDKGRYGEVLAKIKELSA